MIIVSWNINSVRLRIGLVAQLIDVLGPDVLCLQETRTSDEFFPAAMFAERGYVHQAVRGMKGYNGVAIVSRVPFVDVPSVPKWTGLDECRHVSAVLASPRGGEPVALHNFYIPVGGEEPDETLPKFAQKLKFYDEMKIWSTAQRGARAVLVGDLNVAPLPEDVWSHKQLVGVITHTPREVACLEAVQNEGGWVDALRLKIPPPEKVYSWWSYRARDWAASDRGRRLDHIWVSPDLQDGVLDAGVLKDARGWKRPSDHAPVWSEIVF